MTQYTATVSALTAEVRVLMVGSRQVTLSVYRQLDTVPYDQIEPLGRVRDSRDYGEICVIGRRSGGGDLVKAMAHETDMNHLVARNAERSRVFDKKAAELEVRLESALEYVEQGRVRVGRLDELHPHDPEQTDAYNTLSFWKEQAADLREQLDQKRDERNKEVAAEIAENEKGRQENAQAEEWQALPLIVLAGLT